MQCATNRAGFYYEKSSLAAAVLGLVRRQLKSLVVGYIILQIKGCTTAIVQTCRLGLEFCVTKVILKMSLIYPLTAAVSITWEPGRKNQEAGPVLHETPLHSCQSPA
jgi:hypothetical protein